jgi:hypothetical protein
LNLNGNSSFIGLSSLGSAGKLNLSGNSSLFVVNSTFPSAMIFLGGNSYLQNSTILSSSGGLLLNNSSYLSILSSLSSSGRLNMSGSSSLLSEAFLDSSGGLVLNVTSYIDALSSIIASGGELFDNSIDLKSESFLLSLGSKIALAELDLVSVSMLQSGSKIDYAGKAFLIVEPAISGNFTLFKTIFRIKVVEKESPKRKEYPYLLPSIYKYQNRIPNAEQIPSTNLIVIEEPLKNYKYRSINDKIIIE